MVMLTITTLLSAQDVIVTTESQKIDAKILEVSETEVKYKEKANPNGPTFVISTNKIATIIYSNGSVKVYSDETKPATTSVYNANYGRTTTTDYKDQLISKTGNYYHMGNTSMTEEQYLTFIRNNCPEAWQSYLQGQKLWKDGWILFGTGLGCVTIGAAFCWAPYSVIYSSILIGAGGGMTIGSIPCLVIGSNKKRNSYEVYNETCARRNYSSSLEFGIQFSQNGVGVAMNF